MKNWVLIMVFITAINGSAQELTGSELLERAIAHHDPNANWAQFKAQFKVQMTTPDKPVRTSAININLPESTFTVRAVRDSFETVYSVRKGTGSIAKTNLRKPQEVQATTQAEADRAIFMQNYYTYLYGLPMKLKDVGTIVNPVVARKMFKGKEYLVLEVSYSEAVGKDIWFFYFNPTTYAMEVYQFFRTDKTGTLDPNSGEYIILSDNAVIQAINMPKKRDWYYNKGDVFLGTDSIIE